MEAGFKLTDNCDPDSFSFSKCIFNSSLKSKPTSISTKTGNKVDDEQDF